MPLSGGNIPYLLLPFIWGKKGGCWGCEEELIGKFSYACSLQNMKSGESLTRVLSFSPFSTSFLFHAMGCMDSIN